MVNYSRFNTTDDHSFNLYNALMYCKKNKSKGLIFDKGVYTFYEEKASGELVNVSNHDINMLKKIAFLIKGMEDFVVDGNGSEFVFYGSIMPFEIKESKNITIKNFSIDVMTSLTIGMKVTDVKDNCVYADVVGGNYHINNGVISFSDGYGNVNVCSAVTIRSMGDDIKFLPNSCGIAVNSNEKVYFEENGENKIKIFDIDEKYGIKKGMNIGACGSVRRSCNIHIADSENINIENVVMYKGYAMGVIAQMTKNVSVDRVVVKAKEGELNSLVADATHFVHCQGLVKVTNCSFSEQGDDALNIHGIFTKIADKTEDYILIKYMHKQAKGINIYKKGSTIATLDPESLIPNGTYTIKDVEVVSIDYTKIYVEGGTKNINVGDVVEDLTWSCDLIFENNKIANNRGRGMLIGAKGKVVIRNNYFNSTGAAILFESDGRFWFESGATTDVVIENNVFDDCCYVKAWGKGVIVLNPRAKIEEGKYYHKYIKICNNKFISCKGKIISADNVENIVVKDNKIENRRAENVITFENCGEILTDI